MMFLKRTFTAIGALLLISLGGSGTQSANAIAQGTGIIALIIGVIILFVFGKMMLRATGCLTSVLIIGGILIFIIYAIGGFSNGIMGVPAKIKSFLGQSQGAIVENEEVSAAPMLSEDLPSIKKEEPKPQQEVNAFNPLKYPAVIAKAQVVKGDVLRFYNGQYVKLFGIDAPDLTQTCANRQGRSYSCGKQAAAWLKNWVSDYDVKCHILKTDANSNVVGVCFMGQYDIAAAVVNAGWAMATTDANSIYKPYENLANQEKRGLWQGQFYTPADWRKLKSQKGKIKIIEPKKEKKEGLFGF